MDCVLESLQNTSISPNESEIKTSYDLLYKNRGKLGSQEERRKELLEVQKYNRHSKLDNNRGIFELLQDFRDPAIFRNTEKALYRPSIYVAGFNKAPSYSQVLMMSEWLVEKPSDFETHWVVVPAPKGTRTLLVASNGTTRLFNKFGALVYECQTELPGGNSSPRSRKKCCILDCFYQKKTKMLYILDVLAWNSQPMTNGELEFRDFWMRVQLSELPVSVRTISKRNQLTLSVLPKVSCAPEPFRAFMMQIQFENDVTNLDGLLFYQKEAHYFAGETPLVGWLFPYMVPEVLGSDINVNAVYMIQKPESYTTQAAFIAEFESKKKEPKNPRKTRNNSASGNQMDVAELTDDAAETPSAPIECVTKHTTSANDATNANENLIIVP